MQTRFGVSVLAFAFAFFTSIARAYAPAPLRAPVGKGAVAADAAQASRAGAEILARGGNAVDAAIATALALGVVHPMASGLGGGGFLVVWNAKEKAAYTLDFRETAPAASTRDMYLKSPAASRIGGLAVATPGEPAGLVEASRRWGRLPLAEVVKPAVALARDGFLATRAYATAAATVSAARRFPLTPDDPLAAILAPGGRPIVEGQRLRRPDLAATLERLGATGRRDFYTGDTARAIVEAVQKRGGILTLADLAAYQPVAKPPLVGSFRGHTVYAMPPPAGGLTALEALQILDARPPPAPTAAGSSAHLHAVAEALKHAFADRARLLGDPAFVKVPTDKLASPAYARALAARITDGAVGARDAYGDLDAARIPAQPPRDHGTSHLCVVDGEGNVAALTTTINLYFGSGVVAGATGVLLNDEMDDFAAQPGVPNAFGLVGAEANAVAPGKRPLSSMTPLILVKDGRAVLCAGASGGPFIVSGTVQAIVNVVDFKMDAMQAVSAPRLHAQWIPDKLALERDVPADVRDALQRRGHILADVGEDGVVQMILVGKDLLEAASDPRKGGWPAAPQ
jgi:gamma-glutamyltranspeptidase/glutathione hydrolase